MPKPTKTGPQTAEETAEEKHHQKRVKQWNELLKVEILDAKPNPMFSEAQRKLVRFLRFSRSVRCAQCGKKLRIHWTMLCQFIPQVGFGKNDKPTFALQPGKSLAPLTPVCGDHPLAIAWPDEPISK